MKPHTLARRVQAAVVRSVITRVAPAHPVPDLPDGDIPLPLLARALVPLGLEHSVVVLQAAVDGGTQRSPSVCATLAAACAVRAELTAIRRQVQMSPELRTHQILLHLLTPIETEGDLVLQLADLLAQQDVIDQVDTQELAFTVAASRFATEGMLVRDRIAAFGAMAPNALDLRAVQASVGSDWTHQLAFAKHCGLGAAA